MEVWGDVAFVGLVFGGSDGGGWRESARGVWRGVGHSVGAVRGKALRLCAGVLVGVMVGCVVGRGKGGEGKISPTQKKSSEEPFQKLPVEDWKVPRTNKVQKLYLL